MSTFASDVHSRPSTVATARRIAGGRRGSALIYAGAMMSVLFGFAALAVDVGRLRTAKDELQAAADSASLCAANGLSDNTYSAKAIAAAGENKVDGTSVTAASITTTPGNWTNTTFTANGSPRNAVMVLIERTKAKSNPVDTIMGKALGWSTIDVSASAVVALVNQADYQWTGLNSINIGVTSTSGIWSADATNGAAAAGKTALQSNGSVTLTGSGSANTDISYGSTVSVAAPVTVSGTYTNSSTPITYPTGSQVANIAGVAPVYTSSSPLTSSTTMSIGGGVYSVTDATVINSQLTFTGPATIVVSGNLTINNAGLKAYNNLPTNLKIISTGTGTITLTNLTAQLNADIYAPTSALTLNSASGYFGLRGRAITKSFTSSGAGSSLIYDRSLTTTSLARKTIVVR